jgi:hypothetical protein
MPWAAKNSFKLLDALKLDRVCGSAAMKLAIH